MTVANGDQDELQSMLVNVLQHVSSHNLQGLQSHFVELVNVQSHPAEGPVDAGWDDEENVY
jgi:hypothetical protein